MNNLGVVLFSICIGVIFTILTIIFRNKLTAIIGGILWLLPMFYCTVQGFSGDPDFGVYTQMFAIIAFLLAVFTFLAPSVLVEKNKAIIDERSDTEISFDNYRKSIDNHSRAIKATRSLGRRKRPEY